MRLGHDMVHALVPRDLGQIRRVHDAFHRVFTAPDQATAVRTVNAMLSQTRVTARLTEHDGHPLHLLAQGRRNA
ncbi:ABATE domain-containing protein [Nonomuraea rubra]|uniref:ABATE domain-containing protein n=1 Tax=Nonomuraea rubra TaxID=46180 RepID=UPI0036145A67